MVIYVFVHWLNTDSQFKLTKVWKFKQKEKKEFLGLPNLLACINI